MQRGKRRSHIYRTFFNAFALSVAILALPSLASARGGLNHHPVKLNCASDSSIERFLARLTGACHCKPVSERKRTQAPWVDPKQPPA